MLYESFEPEDLKIEPANDDDLLKDEDGGVYGFALPVGEYVLADPEDLLDDGTDAGAEAWHLWESASGASEGIGCDGEVYSARVNGYAVSAIPAYTGSGEFEDDNGKWVSTSTGLIAAVPIELAEKMFYDYSDSPVFTIATDSSANYSENSNYIYFGDDYDLYTGYPEEDR